MNVKPLLDKEFFPYVNRPARYIGNELGSIHKSEESLTRIALAVPDKYDAAMSHVAFQKLYFSLNRFEAISCERVFAPDLDAEVVLREKRIPLSSLESFLPINEFDLLLFYIPNELCLTGILTILDLSGIPMFGKERAEEMPLVGATSPLCLNPEPIADFFDFICIGDIEPLLDKLATILVKENRSEMPATLRRLSEIPGVYVPSLYQPSYSGLAFKRMERIALEVPEIIRAVHCSQESISRNTFIVPYEEVQHEALNIELVQGASHGCRYCQLEEKSQRRDRSVDDVLKEIEDGLSQTGFDSISLWNSAFVPYREFCRLAPPLSSLLADKHIDLRLHFVDPTLKALDAARKLSAPHKPTLSFAVLAGSERLRDALNHYVNIEEFYRTIASAFASGCRSIKLFFIIGIPNETDEDLSSICEIAANCSELGRDTPSKTNPTLQIGYFVPRAHTVWQWERATSVDEYTEKVHYLRRALRRHDIQFRIASPEPAYLAGVFARGDRRLSAVVLRGYQLGARFESWNEHFNMDLWRQAFRECSLAMESYHDSHGFDDPLPWGHTLKNNSTQELREEALRIRNKEKSLFSEAKTFKLGDYLMAKPDLVEQLLVPASISNTSAGFGRAPKRRVEWVAMVVPRSRLRLSWSRDESVRFLGHLATMRVFDRALRRANLPVTVSQGENARQRLAFGPPLALGHTALSEYFDVQLEVPFREEIIVKLNRTLPQGFMVNQGRPVFGKASSLTGLINVACYDVRLPEKPALDPALLEHTLDQQSIKIQRTKGAESREVEIRNSIFKLELREVEGVHHLYMELALGNLGFVRPEEVLNNCLGLDEREVLRLMICRTNLLVQTERGRFTPFEIS